MTLQDTDLFLVNRSNTSYKEDYKTIKDDIVAAVPTPTTPGDGQINVDVGTGLTATGTNATANQSGNTTRTLSITNAGVGSTQLADGAVTVGKVSATSQSANRVLAVNGSNDGMVWIDQSSGGYDFPSGTVMLFYQASAPTGFTQVTTQNNKALRVVSGTGGGTGGSVDFTTAFSDKSGSLSGATVGGTTLTTSQMPSHNHSITIPGDSENSTYEGVPREDGGTRSYQSTGSQGGSGSHTHSITGGSVNFDIEVQYIDVIIASRN